VIDAQSPPRTDVTAEGAGRLDSLDLLRGVAATSVLVYHSTNFLGAQYLPQSYLAVDLFFVLSGFVIAHSYDKRITGGLTVTGFMAQRMLRLYPCYVLALALSFPLGAVRMARDAGHVDFAGLAVSLGLNVVMLPAVNQPYGIASYFPFNGASWSIFFELVANLAYILLFRWLGLRVLLLLIGASAVVLVAGAYLNGTADLGMRPRDMIYGIPRVMVSFFFGVLIRRYVPQKAHLDSAGLRTALVCAVLMAAFAGSDLFAGRPHVLADLVSILVLMPVLVVVASRIRLDGSLRRFATWAGNSSYPVYLLQGTFFLVFAAVPQLFHQRAAMFVPAIGVALVLTTIGTALIVDRYYELPARNFLKRRLSFLWSPRTLPTQGGSGTGLAHTSNGRFHREGSP